VLPGKKAGKQTGVPSGLEKLQRPGFNSRANWIKVVGASGSERVVKGNGRTNSAIAGHAAIALVRASPASDRVGLAKSTAMGVGLRERANRSMGWEGGRWTPLLVPQKIPVSFRIWHVKYGTLVAPLQAGLRRVHGLSTSQNWSARSTDRYRQSASGIDAGSRRHAPGAGPSHQETLTAGHSRL